MGNGTRCPLSWSQAGAPRLDPLSHLLSGNVGQVCSSSLFLVPSLTSAPPRGKVRSLEPMGLFPHVPRLVRKATGTTGAERCRSEEHSPSQRGSRHLGPWIWHREGYCLSVLTWSPIILL